MNSKPNATVRVTLRFSASPERVFDAWLDPQRAGQWLFATPDGEMLKVEIDARVGGKFVFVRRRADDGDVEHVGEYLEIDRPHRLVFTFSVPKYSKEVTRVSIDIVAQAAGCELTLNHEGVLPEWEGPTTSGWTMILNGLAEKLG